MNEAQQIMGVLQFKLSHPIKAHGEEVHELQVKRPTPADCRRIGRMPYVITDNSGLYSPDLSVMGDYISVCCGMPPSSVDQMDLFDFNKLAWEVCGFFAKPESSASSN